MRLFFSLSPPPPQVLLSFFLHLPSDVRENRVENKQLSHFLPPTPIP